ncbi:histidine kinase [Arthrobacter sp. CAU 1506]|uniref:sensor histidine kinase n=1 Tax=Arthrobacter sp. CAU 1506 TaxID=2560052 RepID=UPI0010AD661F|nr:ATP-binding protein [Arthrobacter sp. CAU 1506]TJY69107.1 histidine kinase [Arthrobacter sp. CAU 1506]
MENRGDRRPRMGFSARMLLLQVAVVALVLLLSAVILGWLTYQRLGEDAERQALAVARAVAASGDIRTETAALAQAGPEQLSAQALAAGPLQAQAEDVRRRTRALFVVITDDSGLRLAHPNPAELGRMVSTDPSEALAGREVTEQEQGTLGHSARAKVPVFAPGSAAVVGEVSVGFSSQDVLQSLASNILPIAATTAGALALGLAASLLLGRRLKRLTLGLEPEEIAALTQDQEAVLRGVDEGVIGVSAERRITVFNREAKRLLGFTIDAELVGLPLEQLQLPGPGKSRSEESGLPEALRHLLDAADPQSPTVELVVGPRVLILSAREVQASRTPGRRGYRPGTGTGPDVPRAPELGWVIMLRDRTAVQSLTRQLDAVGALSTALRAQRHEFANRLHTISGLLATGHPDQAQDYLTSIMQTGPLNYPAEQAELLQDPYLQAFIGAKSMEAAERGVTLRVGPETLVRGRVTDPQDVTTVIGNLVDNAVRAAVHGSDPDRWVEVEIMDELTDGGGTLHLVVADSGEGLPGLADGGGVGDDGSGVERIFTDGFSTAGGSRNGPTANGLRNEPAPSGLRNEPAAGPAEPSESVTWAADSPMAEAHSAELPDIHGQGFGLSLIRRLARRRGGDVWVADPGRPGGPGAVFCARLPDTVESASPGANHD